MARRSVFITCALTTACFGALYIAVPQRFFYTGPYLKAWAQSYEPSITERRDRSFFDALSAAALQRPKAKVRYDGAYVRIPYPMGDVPADIGVCTDEVIRSYRALGVDLQQLVHEDMLRAFGEYPNLWGKTAPDSNIDHRRVPILMEFFKRHGSQLALGPDPALYEPGDLVVWQLRNGMLHIGIVVGARSEDGMRPLIVHNIGAGPKLEDALYVGTIVAHFRYRPDGGSVPKKH